MRIVFHGENAASFSGDFEKMVGAGADIRRLPDILDTGADQRAYSEADVIVGVKFDGRVPHPSGLRLFHVPGAGYDAIDIALLPAAAHLCNCFGHEQAIAEYVMGALLARHIPFADADRRLRQGDWTYWAGASTRVHGEIAGKAIGLLGFGHIGRAIARRAKAFEMEVKVANRSPVPTSEIVDEYFALDRLPEFWGSADAIVVSLPLTLETRGIVGSEAFAAMRQDAVIFNVGRGPLLDEAALYEALKLQRIGGAVIDTWYRYPGPSDPHPLPASLPFHELPNIVMTPHMSGWTNGTIRRRQQTIAENIRRCFAGEPLVNLVREGTAAAI